MLRIPPLNLFSCGRETQYNSSCRRNTPNICYKISHITAPKNYKVDRFTGSRGVKNLKRGDTIHHKTIIYQIPKHSLQEICGQANEKMDRLPDKVIPMCLHSLTLWMYNYQHPPLATNQIHQILYLSFISLNLLQKTTYHMSPHLHNMTRSL